MDSTNTHQDRITAEIHLKTALIPMFEYINRVSKLTYKEFDECEAKLKEKRIVKKTLNKKGNK
jgi:hypothetical protein